MSVVLMAPAVDRVESDLTLPADTDVVVIGGGIIGIAAAYFLAKKRLRVAVVEKGHVAGEQSSRNWGWCRTQGKPLVEVPLSKTSLSIWDGLSAELGLDTGFKRSGVLLVTQDPAELAAWETWTEQARDFQIPGQILTPEQVQDRAPSATKWIGGWYSPTDGRAEPTQAAPALARGARALGATLHQGCAARGLETKGGRVSAVITERGTIRTSAVLCAGGAWASMFCRRHGIALPQAGVYASACRTAGAPGVTEGAIGSDGFSIRRRDDGGFTVAMRGRGRVDLTPQALLYGRNFLPMLVKRRKHVTFGLGRSALERTGGAGALVVRRAIAVRAGARFGPAARNAADRPDHEPIPRGVSRDAGPDGGASLGWPDRLDARCNAGHLRRGKPARVLSGRRFQRYRLRIGSGRRAVGG